jgi:hypothetical protein
MARHYRRILIGALLLFLLSASLGAVFGLGAVVGQYRPDLAKPFSDWALTIVLPLQQAYCDVGDVTVCGVSDAGRERVPCDAFQSDNPRHAVLMTFGQSNSANFGQTRYTAGPRVANFNIHDGHCYVSEDPLLGTDGSGGSVWGILGDSLVASGAFDQVLIAPFGIGGTSLKEWTVGGRLHPRVEHAAAQLQKSGITPTHVLWHQGENDARAGTPQNAYAGMFTELVDALRDYGINAPVFVAVATICNNLGSDAIRSAQRGLPNAVEGVYPGADTDSLSDMHDRHDFCHFSQTGLVEHAALWNDSILSFEASKARTSKAAQTAKNPG